MDKIQMKTPLVEMDGDEMTRVLRRMIKDELLSPFVELKTEYYDLGLPERERTQDRITWDAAHAACRLVWRSNVPPSPPTDSAWREYGLSEMWKSPNGTIRAVMDGTVFRAPIVADMEMFPPLVRGWKQPIIIARHAFGDVYKVHQYRVPGAGRAELVFTDRSGQETFRATVSDYDGPGVLQGSFNKDDSIRSFAHACFGFALSVRRDLWFSTKDTISKAVRPTFKLIFQEIYDAEYRAAFERRASVTSTR